MGLATSRYRFRHTVENAGSGDGPLIFRHFFYVHQLS